MATGDLFRLNFFQTVNGNPVMNTFHYLETASADDDDLTGLSIARGFHDGTADLISTVLSEAWTGLGVQIYREIPGPMNPYSMAFVGADLVVVAITSQPIPSNAPMVVTKYTDVASRQGRGRWYQSGIPESYQDGGQLNSATFAGVLAACSAFKNQISEEAGGAGRWNLAVHSHVGLGVAIVKSIVVRPNLANMRSRRSPQGTV